MKIAISAAKDNIDSDISDVFGRCLYFIFLDLKNGDISNMEIVKNIYSEQAGGAGMSAAKFVVEKGAEAVLTNNVGPRALDVLKQFNIKIIEGSGNIKDALKKL